MHKAHYVLMNVECDAGARDELVSAFRFNDAVLRHLVFSRPRAETEPSPLSKKEDKRDDKRAARQAQPATEASSGDGEAAASA